jgi:hypothetical protein
VTHTLLHTRGYHRHQLIAGADIHLKKTHRLLAHKVVTCQRSVPLSSNPPQTRQFSDPLGREDKDFPHSKPAGPVLSPDTPAHVSSQRSELTTQMKGRQTIPLTSRNDTDTVVVV